MYGKSSAQPRLDDRGALERPPFLDTHRALAVCAREFARLCDEIVEGVDALYNAGTVEKPVVRQSPIRCIVQLGPMALTIAWLRSTLDSAAKGELLAIVWRGNVAPRAEQHPERKQAGATAPRLPATALWEQVLTATAESEASWAWQTNIPGDAGYSSTQIAAQCVERLRLAYAEREQDA